MKAILSFWLTLRSYWIQVSFCFLLQWVNVLTGQPENQQSILQSVLHHSKKALPSGSSSCFKRFSSDLPKDWLMLNILMFDYSFDYKTQAYFTTKSGVGATSHLFYAKFKRHYTFSIIQKLLQNWTEGFAPGKRRRQGAAWPTGNLRIPEKSKFKRIQKDWKLLKRRQGLAEAGGTLKFPVIKENMEIRKGSRAPGKETTPVLN